MEITINKTTISDFSLTPGEEVEDKVGVKFVASKTQIFKVKAVMTAVLTENEVEDGYKGVVEEPIIKTFSAGKLDKTRVLQVSPIWALCS